MTDSFPPVGFIPAPSKVSGIEVYLPAEPVSHRPDVMDFKCPKCGATTAYSVELGMLTCEHCGSTEKVETTRLGRAADTFEFKVETIERSQHGWGEARRELACQRCGAVVSVSPDALAYSCSFCGSNKVLFREPLEDVLRPRALIPFKIDPQGCQAITRQWLGSSWLVPYDLKQSVQQNGAILDRFHPIYIPYWTFNAVCKATWKAQVGHEEKEVYFENGERKERTRIVWRNESGKVQKPFSNLLVPGTTRLNLKTLSKVDSYNIDDLVMYEPRYLAGMQAQPYNLPLEEAWDLGRQIMREHTRQACLDKASTTMVRNFSMSLDFSDEQWRYILAPIYTSVYRYREDTFQILINGQTGKIAGPRPVDWVRFWLVAAALVSPGLLLALAGALLRGSEAGSLAGGTGLFLLVTGLIIAFFLFRSAMETENG